MNKIVKRLIEMQAVGFTILLLAPSAHAIQLHTSSEGIITHQVGHLFFLFSMVVLIFTINGKELGRLKGWRFIQYSAVFFVLWNLDTIAAHFLDNQIRIVRLHNISLNQVTVITNNDSTFLAWIYYFLKLDHILCVPAMFFLYKGLSLLVDEQKTQNRKKEPL